MNDTRNSLGSAWRLAIWDSSLLIERHFAWPNFFQGLQLQRSWHCQQLPGKLTPKFSIWCQDSSSFCSFLTRLLSHLLYKKRERRGLVSPNMSGCICPLHSSPQDVSRTENFIYSWCPPEHCTWHLKILRKNIEEVPTLSWSWMLLRGNDV